MLDFEETSEKGNSDALKLLKMQEPVLPAVVFKFLENAPPIKNLELVNEAADILLIRKILSMDHFSQSMANYFAHDDALEPALAVVCENVRNNEDAGAVMRKRVTTFLGMVQSFQKLRSPEDDDVAKTHRPEPKIVKVPVFLKSFHPIFQWAFFRYQKTNACGLRDCMFTSAPSVSPLVMG